MFEALDPKIELPKLEEEILKFWQENKTFQKSLEKNSPQGDWNFLDGPPFVTGLPHYGTLLSSIPKDVFGRFWTMKGYHVRRVWGWDGHGLPIENKVEIKLKIKRKKDIESVVGVKKFIDECLGYVKEVSQDWQWYVDRIGRWVDFKKAYKTWDLAYMESILWVFKQIYEKGYIYQGLRVSLYCPHCATPISNFEVAMDSDNYKEITEPSDVYKYQLADDPTTFLLAWSTTPWNKLATPALAVNPKLTYVKVKQGEENYILAKTTLKMLKDEPYKITDEFLGKDLIGKKFVPHYDFYKIDSGKQAFIVIGGDFVTAEEGTGIVTIAPYGEEDLAAMKENNIQFVLHVDEEGHLKPEVPNWAGMYYLDVNEKVNQDLKDRGLLYREDLHSHSVPTCWRCHTRLFYAPQDAWFVNIQKLKPDLKKTNEAVNWFPEHFKTGRYLNSLEAAPDWCISRSRYWGCPVPVWKCENCAELFVPGSIAELEGASNQKVDDLHKPRIDQLKVECRKCGQMSTRVPEVLDSWIEAGSASFAERHYPFEISETDLKKFFPPDFITEYTGQIRAWFYVLHVIATALYQSKAFKNVLVTGVILGTDGRKMSKNYGNYPDPKEMLLKYGGDALRLYLLGSPVMKGEDILISEETYAQQTKFLRLLLNIYNFFATYASVDNFSSLEAVPGSVPEPVEGSDPIKLPVLDQWILLRLDRVTEEVTQRLDSYDTVEAVRLLQNFVNDLSLWYVRHCRSRVGPTSDNGPDKNNCYQTLYYVLKTLCQLLAPITPFISEKIYQNLTGKESVHLSDWPVVPRGLDPKGSNPVDNLEIEMDSAMKLASKIHARRKENNLAVKIPLKKLEYRGPQELSAEITKIVLAEVNVDELKFDDRADEYLVKGEVGEGNQDLVRGQVRDLIRQIQQLRKEKGLSVTDRIKVFLPASPSGGPSWPKEFEEVIKKETLAIELKLADSLKIEVI